MYCHIIGEKSVAIAAKLAALFPGIDTTPAFAWAKAFGRTASGLPVIRRVPRRPRLHAVLGHGGNGITLGRIAAEIVAADLGGGVDFDADLFAG